MQDTVIDSDVLLHDSNGQTDLTEEDWESLIQNIELGMCTPFLGAGACVPPLLAGSELALQWAVKHKFPLEDTYDLARVAQYLAVTRGPMFPKGRITLWMKNLEKGLLDFKNPEQPHAMLADLPLPIYLTTNYDDFMEEALRSRNKKPRREYCRWNNKLRNLAGGLDDDFQPTAQEPLVYHLHGCWDIPESLVLTEDDYVDFLISFGANKKLLPTSVQLALSNSLLFLGYRLADLNFKVIFRSVKDYLEAGSSPVHVSVQLDPLPATMPDEQKKEAFKYLNKYFEGWKVRVFWGTCQKFSRRLRDKRGVTVA